MLLQEAIVEESRASALDLYVRIPFTKARQPVQGARAEFDNWMDDLLLESEENVVGEDEDEAQALERMLTARER